MMRNIKEKKADLSLSVNAIVILVLAITMLSLGLMFIRNIFGNTISQFEDVGGQMKEQMMQQLQESNSRLSYDRSDYDIKKGNKKTIYFAIKNDLGEDDTFGVNREDIEIENTGEWIEGSGIKCYHTTGGIIKETDILFKTIDEVFIKNTELKVYKVDIRVSSSAVGGTYSCSHIIQSPPSETTGNPEIYARKDFFINVN